MTNRTVLLFIAVSLLVSCNTNRIRPSGNILSVERSVGHFDGVEVSSGLNATVTIGDGEGVTVTADDNILPYIETFTDGGTLRVKVRRHTYFRGNPRISVAVAAAEIDHVSASGGSRVDLKNGLTTNNLSIDLSGGPHFKGSATVDGRLEAEVSGGGEIDINGSCGDLDLKCSGGSEFSGFGFSADNVNANLSGGSKAEMTVVSALNVHASGGSKLRYKGDPNNVQSDASGGSKVEKVN